jgi:hypothetical protein
LQRVCRERYNEICLGLNLLGARLVLPHFVCLSLKNTMKDFAWVLFGMCGLPLPPLMFLLVINGAAFPSGELGSFLGFLPGLTELAGVKGSIMLQRRKYFQRFCNVLVVCICCKIIVKLLLFCYGNHCALFIYLFIYVLVLFTVIKYLLF